MSGDARGALGALRQARAEHAASRTEQGKHVGRVESLADLAAELGFDRADVVRSLSANEYLADVKADQAMAIEYGIQGVPFFVIDGRYGVSGAQDAATFASVLAQVRDEKESVA